MTNNAMNNNAVANKIAKLQKQLDSARAAWKAAKTPAQKAFAEKAGLQAKAKLAELQGQSVQQPAPTPAMTPLQEKYHTLKEEALAQLEAEYAEKVKSTLLKLKAEYEAELEGFDATPNDSVVYEEPATEAEFANPGEYFEVDGVRYLVVDSSINVTGLLNESPEDRRKDLELLQDVGSIITGIEIVEEEATAASN